MGTTGAEPPPEGQVALPDPPSLVEQVRELDPPPFGDGSYYAQEGVFDSDAEMEEFVAFVREGRRTGLA